MKSPDIVGLMDAVLSRVRANPVVPAALLPVAAELGIEVADLYPVFQDHGAASDDPFVFARDCSTVGYMTSRVPEWLTQTTWAGEKQEVSQFFDPHPNDGGAQAIAEAILGVLG